MIYAVTVVDSGTRALQSLWLDRDMSSISPYVRKFQILNFALERIIIYGAYIQFVIFCSLDCYLKLSLMFLC